MGPVHGELEVLAPLEDGGNDGDRSPPPPLPPLLFPGSGAPAERHHRRRWPVVLVVGVVVAAAVAFPVRDAVARQELRWLERQWAQAQADDQARITAEQKMKSYLPVTDPGPVDTALAALYRDEQLRYQALRSRLGRAFLVDSRLRGLRSDLARALGDQADRFAAIAGWYGRPTAGSPPETGDDLTVRDGAAVGADLAANRAHWGELGPLPVASATSYPSAEAEIARLSRWLDRPLGVALLSISNQHLTQLDVDQSRAVTIPGPPIYTDRGTLVARSGYVVFIAQRQAWAVAPDGSGPPRALAAGSSVFAAADPGAVWVADNTRSTATEVDGSGRVIAGPVPVTGLPVGATSTALVVLPPDQSAIEVRSVADGSPRCRLGSGAPVQAGVPYVLAVQGELVAWVDASDRVHVTDSRTCADRPGVAPKAGVPLQASPAAVAAFSPDGRRLAIAASDQDVPGQDVYFLHVVDLASAQATAVPVRSGFPIRALAWTADGTRLFWLSGGPVGVSPALATWRLGDAAVEPLRVFDLGLAPVLLAVP